MRRSILGNLWLDHLATIGIGLSLVVLAGMTSAVPLWLVGGLAAAWLLWEWRRWWKQAKLR